MRGYKRNQYHDECWENEPNKKKNSGISRNWLYYSYTRVYKCLTPKLILKEEKMKKIFVSGVKHRSL